MLNIAGVNVYLATQPVDMRKGIQGLSLLVSSSFELNPLSGHVFVFYNKARQKLKLLY
jgi:transposase